LATPQIDIAYDDAAAVSCQKDGAAAPTAPTATAADDPKAVGSGAAGLSSEIQRRSDGDVAGPEQAE
jgi:hypothetical protein